MASNPLPFLFEIEFRMIPIIPKHVRKRKRDCVNHAANGSSSKNSPPRVSANGRLLRKNWRQNAMIFFPSLLGSLVIVLAIASSGGLNVGNAKLPFRIGWTRRRRFHQKLPIPNEALLEIREPIINITFSKKSNQFFERAKLTNFKLKIDYTIM